MGLRNCAAGRFLIAFSLTVSLGGAAPAQAPDGVDLESGTDVPEETTPRADLSEANRLVTLRKYPQAVEVLGSLREEFPEDPALLLMLGELLLATGEPANALETLARAAEIDPRRERVQLQLATALVSAGREEEALAAFAKELENSETPDVLVTARLNRSLLLQRSLRWLEAADELEMALQFQPDRVQVYADLATLYAEAGRLEDAERALARGASFGFRSASHSYSLGARYYLQQRYDDAVRLFLATLEVDPNRPDAERSLAAALEKLGRRREAATHLRRYLELKPETPDRERILEQIEAAGAD